MLMKICKTNEIFNNFWQTNTQMTAAKQIEL